MDCTHLDLIGSETAPVAEGCVTCLATNGTWVHLRWCLTCGNVGCCDDSPGTHARKHAAETGHFLVQSFEEGEDWVYCFDDGTFWEHRVEVPQ